MVSQRSNVKGLEENGMIADHLVQEQAQKRAYKFALLNANAVALQDSIVLLDMDAGELTFWRNGSTMGLAYTGLTGTIFPMAGGDTNSVDSGLLANFGATAFSYSPPAGYNAGLYL